MFFSMQKITNMKTEIKNHVKNEEHWSAKDTPWIRTGIILAENFCILTADFTVFCMFWFGFKNLLKYCLKFD